MSPLECDDDDSCGGCALAPRRTFLLGMSGAVLAAMVGTTWDSDAAVLPLTVASGAQSGGNVRTYAVPAKDGATIDRDAQVILVRLHGQGYAFNLACPHENTVLRWRPEDSRFQCPRHGSRTAGRHLHFGSRDAEHGSLCHPADTGGARRRSRSPLSIGSQSGRVGRRDGRALTSGRLEWQKRSSDQRERHVAARFLPSGLSRGVTRRARRDLPGCGAAAHRPVGHGGAGAAGGQLRHFRRSVHR